MSETKKIICKCGSCKREFDEEEFKLTNDKDKCILHCEKDENSNVEYFEDSFFKLVSCKYGFNDSNMDEFIKYITTSVYPEDRTYGEFCDSKLKNKIILSGIKFPFISQSMSNALSLIKNVSFKRCDFIDNPMFSTKENVFYFWKCKFKSEWEHIYCKSSIYRECEFESYINSNISKNKILVDKLLFMDCKFKFIKLEGLEFKEELFKHTNQLKYEYREACNFEFIRCKFNSNLIIYDTNRENDDTFFNITKLNLTDSIFERNVKVKVQFCKIANAIFYNTSFHDLADFYQTKFEKVDFRRADFLSISVFSESEFESDVDFSYVKFFGKAIFRDTVIKGTLNLRNSIFNDEANFLDITSVKRKQNAEKQFIGEPVDIKVANRETARIIKNFYDNSNNIIEANRFYKLEMKERENELDFNKRPIEWLVFKSHGFASNHSQDWILPLLLIIILGLVYSLFSYNGIINETEINKTVIISIKKYSDSPLQNIILFTFVFSSICTFFVAMFRKEISFIYLLIVFVFASIYICYTKDIQFIILSNSINPFSIMTGKDSLTGIGLIFKIIIAYLIYQLIISIRQNTRRK